MLDEHRRKRRPDLGLRQRDMGTWGRGLGVGVEAVPTWRPRLKKPPIRRMAAIIAFLGYDPEPPPEGLAGRLFAVRRRLGLTEPAQVARLGHEEGQICR
jgi:hypothetical protein